MSEYIPQIYKDWYALNKERIRDSKKVAKKKYRRTEAGKLAQKKYNQKPTTKLRYRKYHFFTRYGITLEGYEKMVIDREGKCDICHYVANKLHVDHCHKTGKIRGLLCGNCNKSIGLMRESSEILNNAIEYLKHV